MKSLYDGVDLKEFIDDIARSAGFDPEQPVTLTLTQRDLAMLAVSTRIHFDGHTEDLTSESREYVNDTLKRLNERAHLVAHGS